MKKRNFKPLLVASGILSAISILGLILILGIQLPAFGMWFYYWQYDANDTYAQVAMMPEHLHDVTRHMIEYMRGRTPDLQIYTMVDGEMRPFFSDIEIRHMVDVMVLARIMFIVRNVLAVLAVVSLVPFALLRWERRDGQIIFLKCWKWVSGGIFAALAILAGIIAINWHRAWWVFHEIFFSNDYWILDPRVDLLINIVPYPFFLTMSIFIGAFFALGLVLMFVISAILLRRRYKSASYW